MSTNLELDLTAFDLSPTAYCLWVWDKWLASLCLVPSCASFRAPLRSKIQHPCMFTVLGVEIDRNTHPGPFNS